jgi:predicted Zn-dependent peptidase
MGVSHFLEHMMFKGTADLSAEDDQPAFDDIGAPTTRSRATR